jgi:hypothetical protein
MIVRYFHDSIHTTLPHWQHFIIFRVQIETTFGIQEMAIVTNIFMYVP